MSLSQVLAEDFCFPHVRKTTLRSFSVVGSYFEIKKEGQEMLSLLPFRVDVASTTLGSPGGEIRRMLLSLEVDVDYVQIVPFAPNLDANSSPSDLQ